MTADLQIDSLSITFGGVTALSDVSMTFAPGERVAVIGPNGAGKSTLINCIAGVSRPSNGAIRLDGSVLGRTSVAARARRGLARTFQNLELFTSMTVFENIAVALDSRSRFATHPWRWGVPSDEAERAYALLEELGISRYASARVGTLPYGVRKLVELARAFIREPRVLLLDEPVAGLTDPGAFMDLLVAQLDSLNCTVILVEHDMATVQRLCQRVYVLDSGRVIASGSYDEISKDPRVVEAYLGGVDDDKKR